MDSSKEDSESEADETGEAELDEDGNEDHDNLRQDGTSSASDGTSATAGYTLC